MSACQSFLHSLYYLFRSCASRGLKNREAYREDMPLGSTVLWCESGAAALNCRTVLSLMDSDDVSCLIRVMCRPPGKREGIPPFTATGFVDHPNIKRNTSFPFASSTESFPRPPYYLLALLCPFCLESAPHRCGFLQTCMQATEQTGSHCPQRLPTTTLTSCPPVTF